MSRFAAKPLFSIILPVFNEEAWLGVCLDSLAGQSRTEFEIIIVDDGSTDASLAMAQKYAGKDQRIRIFRQARGGAGKARNFGFGQATGEYVLFLDADDQFEPDLLAQLEAKFASSYADLLVFRSSSIDAETGETAKMPWTINNRLLPCQNVFRFQDVPKDIFLLFNWWGWDKAYRRSFLLANNLHHQEILSTNDLFFNLTAYLKAERISTIQTILAHHRINVPGSVSTLRDIYFENCLFALYWCYVFIKENNLWPKLELEFINYAIHLLLWHLENIKLPLAKRLGIVYKYRYAHYFKFAEYKSNPAINLVELTKLLTYLPR